MTKSCGYSLPLYEYIGERTILKDFSSGKGNNGMIQYRGYKNSYSTGNMKISYNIFKCINSKYVDIYESMLAYVLLIYYFDIIYMYHMYIYIP